MPRNWKPRRDDAGSMLASVIIIVGGAGVCAFIAGTSSSDASAAMLGFVVTAAVFLITFIIWFRYGRRSENGLRFWLSLSRNHREDGIAAQYRPRKVRDKSAETPVGTNQPITAEEVHDIQESSANTWVPTRHRQSRQRDT